MASSEDASPTQVTQADYETLAEFRYLIRCFLDFSESAAREMGLSPRQHQALLAIRGFPGGQTATIGDLAERLRIRHNSAVELVDRLSESGLIVRRPDDDDHRRVYLSLTQQAESCLEKLSAAHLDEVARLKPMLQKVLANH